jgi:hypothetical protein
MTAAARGQPSTRDNGAGATQPRVTGDASTRGLNRPRHDVSQATADHGPATVGWMTVSEAERPQAAQPEGRGLRKRLAKVLVDDMALEDSSTTPGARAAPFGELALARTERRSAWLRACRLESNWHSLADRAPGPLEQRSLRPRQARQSALSARLGKEPGTRTGSTDPWPCISGIRPTGAAVRRRAPSRAGRPGDQATRPLDDAGSECTGARSHRRSTPHCRAHRSPHRRLAAPAALVSAQRHPVVRQSRKRRRSARTAPRLRGPRPGDGRPRCRPVKRYSAMAPLVSWRR